MPDFRPEELSHWLSAPWKNGVPEKAITGISKDTRTIQSGDLYVAIRGDNFDGHTFVSEAFKKGAVGALVEEDFAWSDNPVLQVTDTIAGLQDLARGYRKNWTGKVIGITGSVGKTTVKEMCADVLSMSGETHRTAGNYNNHIGLPLTMLAMPAKARYGVFEIGMNHPGEIGPLTDLLQPEIGILTEIGNAHRESFDSLEEIAREKMQLIANVPAAGCVILDQDTEWYPMISASTVARVVTVSFGGSGDYVGRRSGNVLLDVNDCSYGMPQPGEHMMRNALRAIALGLELGMEPAQIAEGLGKFKAPPMRWQESTQQGIIFVNDAYNANPLSMRASLGTFTALSGAGKKWAVVGGMRELGQTEEKEHAALGQYIDSLGLKGVITVGALGEQVVCEKVDCFFHCADTAEAARILKDNLAEGDRVLLKASRGERLEQVLNYFEES